MAQNRFLADDAITTAPDQSPLKTIIYGRPGDGKTYFASTIPDVFILHVEEGLKGSSPDHAPGHFKFAPQTLDELHMALDAFAQRNTWSDAAKKRRLYRHLVVDSISGIETLVHLAACGKENVSHMEGKEFKVVWSRAKSMWLAIRSRLDEIRRSGVNVWLLAHAVEVHESNLKGDSYRPWDILMSGSGAALTEARELWKGWADNIFFLHRSVEVTPGNAKGKRARAKFTGRVFYTSSEYPGAVCKSRMRLASPIPATWDDLYAAMVAGLPSPEAKIRTDIADILPRLSPEARAKVEADVAAAKTPTALNAALNRARATLAVETEEAGPRDEDDPTDQDAANAARIDAGEEPAPRSGS